MATADPKAPVDLPDPKPNSALDKRATQTVRSLTQQGEEKPKYFFIRRVPRRNIAREWSRPADDQYTRDLMNEGFITETLLKGSFSDDLRVDIRELDQHLLPHFWRTNQRARFFQNRFYQYQWTFILAAFLTTALAAVNVFVYAQGWQGGTSTPLGRIPWTEILGLSTAIISGVAAAVSFLDANQTPQKQWYKARAQAEALRSIYFTYLGRLSPFNTANTRDRVQLMRERVLEVLQEARRGDQTGTTGQFRIPSSPPPEASPTPGDEPKPSDAKPEGEVKP